jgi:hypothetical protein
VDVLIVLIILERLKKSSMPEEPGLVPGLCETEGLLPTWKKMTSKMRNGEGAYEGV